MKINKRDSETIVIFKAIPYHVDIHAVNILLSVIATLMLVFMKFCARIIPEVC